MIKVILTLVFSSIAYLGINAQSLSIGPVIGANASTISSGANFERVLGISVGAFANYSINEKVGLNVKALYSQMGANVENTETSIRLNYLQIPLSGVYFFGQSGDSFRPKVFLGPYVGFLLGAKNQNDQDIKSSYKSLDIGGQLGLGFNYSLKNSTWLNVDFIYSSGFSSAFSADNAVGNNNALTLNLGLSFPISGS